MKKDELNILPVEGVQVAIARKINELNENEWFVYLINHNDHPLENVLVSSKGYGTIDGNKKKTSILRHMIEKVEAESCCLIEPIQPELFQLSNEFWVSYYIGRQIYDKKFVFVEGSINENNLTQIPILEEEGILHS